MNLRLAPVVLLALSLLAQADVPASTDWPQFHGPKRDNISTETGLLQDWPAGGPAIAWRIDTIGAGFSSVSVVGGKIFTAGDVGKESFVFALDQKDGKQLWKSRLGDAASPGGYVGTRATPTIDGDSAYMMSQNGDVVAYAVADGKELWRTNLNKEHGGKMMSGWGNSESVYVDGNNVICTPGGKNGTVLALDKKTGKQVWRSTDFKDDAAYSSPFVVEIGGVRQVPILTNKSVAGVAADSGKLLWRADRPGQTAVIPTPIVKDNYVFVASGYGVGCDLFKVDGGGGNFSVSPVYTHNKEMVNHHGGVILWQGNLYGFSDPPERGSKDSGWTCMDFLTGKRKWRESKLGKGTITYADNRFYLRAEGPGTIVLIEASPDGWKEHGRFEQPDRTKQNAWPHLVISGGRLYVRDQTMLFCYDVKGK